MTICMGCKVSFVLKPGLSVELAILICPKAWQPVKWLLLLLDCDCLWCEVQSKLNVNRRQKVQQQLFVGGSIWSVKHLLWSLTPARTQHYLETAKFLHWKWCIGPFKETRRHITSLVQPTIVEKWFNETPVLNKAQTTIKHVCLE